MILFKKIAEFIKDLNSESDEGTDQFIDREYSGLMQMSTIYSKMDKKHITITSIQLILYFTNCIYHWTLLLKGLILFRGQNFVLYSKCAYFFMLYQVSWMVIIIATSKHKQIAIFHKRMSENFYDYGEPKSALVDRLGEEMLRERRLLVMIPIGTSIGALFVYVLAPICDTYLGTYDLSKSASIVDTALPIPLIANPFTTKDSWGYYLLALIPQLMGGAILPLVIGGGGYLYIVMSGNLSTQLKILIDSLECVEIRAAQYYFEKFGRKIKSSVDKFSDPNFNLCFNECLKRNFEHHQMIISMFDILYGIFTIPIFLAYLTGTTVIALSLLSNNVRELPGTTVSSMLLCIVEVGYMALFSALGQRITDLSADLRVAIYNIRWYYSDERVKGSVRIVQAMTLKPMTIISGGIIPVSLDTFAKVMNTAYSYYNLVMAFDTN